MQNTIGKLPKVQNPWNGVGPTSKVNKHTLNSTAETFCTPFKLLLSIYAEPAKFKLIQSCQK